MMTSTNSRKNKKLSSDLQPGFTLFEMIVVLAVISTAVAVAMPYATRSNYILSIRQDALNIKDTLYYSIDLAQNLNSKIKLSINTRNKTYCLLKENDSRYEPVEGYFGITRGFNKNISVGNTEGLINQADECYLIIDPTRTLPDATLELGSKDIIIKIIITARKVDIEETGI